MKSEMTRSERHQSGGLNQSEKSHPAETREPSSTINESKRLLLASGLGLLTSVIEGCARDVDQNTPRPTPGGSAGSGAKTSTTPVTSNAPASTNGDGQVSVNCGCMPGTANPPAAGTPTNGTVALNGLQQYGLLGPAASFALAAADMTEAGSLTMLDGAVVPVWGFTAGTGLIGFNGDRPIPAPTLVVTEGATVGVTLTSMHPHSLHLHGLDVTQPNDGVPSTSGYVGHNMMGGGPANFGRVAGYASLGGSYTYQFVAPKAGTYMYHCHVDTVLHMEMGMYGTIVVRPPDGSNTQLWANGPVFSKEYIWQLHTVASTWHTLLTSTANVTHRYQPDYFLINGRDGAQLIADPTVRVAALAGEIVVIRLVNLGYLPAVVKLGGIPFDVVASDGRPLKRTVNAVTELMVHAGERYDVIFTMPVGGAIAPATVEYWTITGTRIAGTATTSVAQI